MAKSKLAAASTADLKRELARREKQKDKLLKKREKVAKQLAELDSQLTDLGIEAPATATTKKRRGRPPKSAGKKKTTKEKTSRKKTGRGKNKLSLSDMLEKVMSKDTPMGIKELSQAVKDAGYKSSSKQFNTIVTQTLNRDDRFKRVGRGQYTLA